MRSESFDGMITDTIRSHTLSQEETNHTHLHLLEYENDQDATGMTV